MSLNTYRDMSLKTYRDMSLNTYRDMSLSTCRDKFLFLLRLGLVPGLDNKHFKKIEMID